MKKLKGWLVLGGLSLLAGVAHADFNVRDKGTYYGNASTGLKTDVNGNLATTDYDRDRDFPLITNLFAGQQLGAGQIYQMITAVPAMQYTRAAIMLTSGQVRGSRAHALLSARSTRLPVQSVSCCYWSGSAVLLLVVYRTLTSLSSEVFLCCDGEEAGNSRFSRSPA